MWLINCNDYSLVSNDIDGPNAIPYIILSHTWGNDADEVTFHDMRHAFDYAIHKKGFEKIQQTCEIALEAGVMHAWIDTCCIDKSSSAELTESINSMFHWYSRAERCVAYLQDLSPSHHQPTLEELRPCRWFTRGWTLQELIAPQNVDFYDQNWNLRGTKVDLYPILSDITSIDPDTLRWPQKLSSVPVARKMSWAAKRQSKRIEDTAYCLLGIFGIHMPLIYGERDRAFIRLQEHIAQKNNDMTLFAWCRDPSEGSGADYAGLFAKHPSAFRECTNIRRLRDPVIPTPSWIITNAGVEMDTALEWFRDESVEFQYGYRLYLHCTYAGIDFDDSNDIPVLSIWLRKTKSGYLRFDPGKLCLTSLSEMRFGQSTRIRIAATLGDREIGDVIPFYQPQSHLLNSAISFEWQDEVPDVRFTRSFHPQHLWDENQLCFFTSSSPRFIALMEIEMRSLTNDPAVWEDTCWLVCGLHLNAIDFSAAGGDRSPRPWVMVLRQTDGGSIEGLEGYTRKEIVNPFSLSTIGYNLRDRFIPESPTAGDCIFEYRTGAYLNVSARILSRAEQLERGRTILISATHFQL
ncbi:putative vegetative incompatibility HET containing-domain protein [Podospora australis]|uniref:Vegetative incompatibility HET containing-domain protein n=1 Tax=Podospora australis TaxID=1536484 RepID=A0AAN6WNZ1_9PEZI|nr:putative vegetative incompatibility HET containing-domain protein [Podospora australis]